jgi:PAS domain S-box-containing protein
MTELPLPSGKDQTLADASAGALEQLLKAADVMLELLPVATCICDLSGRIVQYNQRAVEIWGRRPAPNQTHAQFTARATFYQLDGRQLPREEIPMAMVLRTGEPIRERELMVEHPDGVRHFVSVNIAPLTDAAGNRIGAINCFRDITARKQTQHALERSQSELREQEQRLAATYEHAAIGISEADADGRLLRVNEAMCVITGFPREELVGAWLFQKTYQPDAEADRSAFRRQVSGDLGIYSVEKRFVRKDGRVIWISVRSAPVRDADGHFLFAVRVVQDITERKAAEERQKLLVDELNHRVKNTLATVQSLAKQTAGSALSAGAFRERFEGRLIALSKAHDQLTMRNWQNADLRAILKAAIAPYVTTGRDQAVLRGEDIMLRPRAAVTLAMVFHELTTNAVKYGALSVPSGRIQVSWDVRPPHGRRPLLCIDWREEGGPPVQRPAKKSFGSRFIEGSIPSELQGKARLTYEASGLHCTLEIPLGSAQGDLGRRAGVHAVALENLSAAPRARG